MRVLFSPLSQALNDRWLRLILLVAFLLALAYNGTIALGYGPDEGRHMAYVRLLIEEHRLPRILSLVPYSEYKGAHAFHPPLYYLILAPFYLIFGFLTDEHRWHVVRLVSTALCLAALPMIFALGERASGGDRRVARMAAGTVGLTPMFGMTASIINNDSAGFFFTVLFLYLLAVPLAERRDLKAAALLGLVMGLGGLCKATVLLCDGVAILAAPVLAGGWGSLARPQTWKFVGITLLAGGLLVSPWHIRSFNLYHQWNPMPPPAPWFQPPLPPLLEIAHPSFPHIFAVSNWGIFYTLWGQRDWFRQAAVPALVQPPPLQPAQAGIYAVITFCTILGLAGLILLKVRARAGGEEAQSAEGGELAAVTKLAFWTPLLAFFASWAVVLEIALFMHQGWAEGGRYLLPALCGLTIALSIGWKALFGGAFRIWSVVWLTWLILLNLVSLHWLITYLNPMYVK